MAEPLRLGDHCEKIGSGATPRGGKETYSSDGPIALIRSQNVHNDRFTHGGLAFISEEQAAQLQNVAVNEGDVLLNITGDSVARACQVDPHVLPARVNQHVAIIRPRQDRIDPRFLRYYLVTPAMQAYMLGLAAAGATRNALTKSMIEEFSVPALPVKLQTAIASVPGALDDKIELNRRMNETLEAMARAIFRDWFVDFGPTRAKMEGRAPYYAPDIWSLFPDRLDDEGKPEGWPSGRLDDLLVLQRGFDLPSNVRIPGSVTVMAASGPNGTHNKAMVRGPGVTTGRSGVLGRVFLVLEDFWPLNTSLWIKEFKLSSPFHAYFLLQDLDFAAFNAGSAVPTLNRNHVHSLLIPLAPKALVNAFDDFCRPMMCKIRANEIESETLATTRDFLLPKLMSGEVPVRDAEKLVGEVA